MISLFARVRRSIFPLMRSLSIIKAGEQHTVKTSHIVIISQANSTHTLVKVLVPVVFIFELTNAVLTGYQFSLAVSACLTRRLKTLYFPDAQKNSNYI